MRATSLARRFATFAFILALFLAGTGSLLYAASIYNPQETALRNASGISVWQGREVVHMLSQFGVSFKSVRASTNHLIDGMDNDWSTYDLIDNAQRRYTLILSASDGDFTAVFDQDNNLLAGIVYSSITPCLFNEN